MVDRRVFKWFHTRHILSCTVTAAYAAKPTVVEDVVSTLWVCRHVLITLSKPQQARHAWFLFPYFPLLLLRSSLALPFPRAYALLPESFSSARALSCAALTLTLRNLSFSSDNVQERAGALCRDTTPEVGPWTFRREL